MERKWRDSSLSELAWILHTPRTGVLGMDLAWLKLAWILQGCVLVRKMKHVLELGCSDARIMPSLIDSIGVVK